MSNGDDRAASEAYYNVVVTLHGGAAAGTYSLYENVDGADGKPYHVAEDAWKGTRDVEMREYADKLVRLYSPSPQEVDAPLEDVTWYFTDKGWEEYIESESKLDSFFNDIPRTGIRPPYESATFDVTRKGTVGRLAYKDEYQVAAIE